ncbi:hypothetical protein HXX76_007982 [Chlamydomonas incerta]|uniref:COX assembly mitochondrial protein n=1 Tax=Chlamydomonas incerta TaxID=51695 RepID=A0A835SVU2_CHLIN|nr:hypothetical protein HXX76_007982 [Chlamydomonas incerta]|eukprot:KAG2434257.1 hypothetical protein HXX76_007982 [Chlamydomonas incerta]
MCGKYMEALLECRKENPYRKFFGVCSEITWELSMCLKEEKKVTREPRQKRYHERWAAKREADKERMAQIRAENAQDQDSSEPAGGSGLGRTDE